MFFNKTFLNFVLIFNLSALPFSGFFKTQIICQCQIFNYHNLIKIFLKSIDKIKDYIYQSINISNKITFIMFFSKCFPFCVKFFYKFYKPRYYS